MRSTVTINLNRDNPHPVHQHFYSLRALIGHLRWLLHLYRMGGRFSVHITFDDLDEARWKARNWVRKAWGSRDPRYTVVAHRVSQEYGGPEEGGWWFQTRYVEKRVKVWRKRDLDSVMDALVEEYPNTGRSYSVLGGDDYRVRYYGRFTHVYDYEDDYSPYC